MPRARYYQLKRMQLLLANQSEDCLYLNVYAPSEGFAGGGSTSLASSPVMVLVHGESYSWGAGHLMDGAMLAGKSRMVVVTLNYRLGILGFLQTAASPTPGQVRGKSKSAIPTQGNYGLLDIVAAVLWLKDNIGVFGGDSSRITLSGHGTGAALVNLLMISPIAAGLFQRVVLMSGSALSPWALNHQAGKLKAEVARQMDCEPFAGSDGAASAEQMSLADIGDCLRKKPLESLMAVRLPAPPRFFASFAPFVDGAGIVAIDPLRAMQSASEDFARIPLVAGVTSIESYRYTGDADLRNGISEDKRDRSLRTLIRNFYQYHLNEIFYVLRNEYTDWDRPSALDDLSMRDSLSLALSDALVVAPLMHVVHLHAQRSTNPSGTFFYHFQGQMLASVIQQQVQDVDLSEYHRLGSVTGDELEALQLDATANGASWSSADGKQQHAHLKTHYRGHQIAVWLQLIPSLHQTIGDGTGTHPSIHHTFDQHNTPADQFYEGTGDWTIVNPSVMASETGSSSSTVPSPGNNNNSTSVSVAGGESRLVLGFFWTNQATLSIILVLGNILLIVNLILFVTIYRRSRCGNCKRNGDDNDVDTENTIQRISDGQLEGRVARQSIESMTDLRQLVISHCHQHPRSHPDITSQALGQQHPPLPPQQQHQPLFANGVVSSDLTTSTRLPSPQPFLLRVPSPHHQFLLDESNKSATLPGSKRAGGRDPPDSSATYQQASAKSIQEINV
ncbi:hypothetical protein DAPPUDRAFT_311742 [Daphnia pulex]|uniref:Carboxylesterase type B domain-containing protein n=1 Tax=Daphnia pulex TaxID=6669 RepID=E9FXS6_DAPPU|nr:hypothetical protein DAPPUDRAFT_311742 [Daphnia pulex]|eukprot:EFX88148.1 hypothetical protein DAPPUDRAFT_311742 [Daphnia pulex]